MGGIAHLVWDEWNLAHVWDEHKVTPKEALDAVTDESFSPRLIQVGDGPRYLFVGSTAAGRRLAVVVRELGHGAGYVTAARDLSENEREFFRRRGSGSSRRSGDSKPLRAGAPSIGGV